MQESGLKRGQVIPSFTEASGVFLGERPAKSHPEIGDADHYDLPPEPLRPVVRLDPDPAAALRVLDDVLTYLGKHDAERYRIRLRIVELLPKDGAGALLDVLDHSVHVLVRLDLRNLQQDVRRADRLPRSEE